MTGLHETVELADEAWNTRTLQSAQARTETVEGDVVEHIDNIQTFCDGHHIDQCIDDEIRAVRAELTRTAPAEDVMEVDVEALKDYRTVRGITKMGEDFHLHGWNDCIDHLHEQGHLSPTPRKTLEDAQARSDMAEFAKIDDFEDVPLKTLDNSEQTDTNVAPRKTLNDAQNHNWDKSKFVRIDMETGEKVEPRLEHIEGLEEAIQVASGYEFDLGAVCSEDDYLVFLKAAKAYAADMEEK